MALGISPAVAVATVVATPVQMSVDMSVPMGLPLHQGGLSGSQQMTLSEMAEKLREQLAIGKGQATVADVVREACIQTGVKQSGSLVDQARECCQAIGIHT